MTAKPFNAGWSYRQPLGPFAAAQGASVTPTPVTLPHDALRDADRSPDVPGHGAGAYHPPGAYTDLPFLRLGEANEVRVEVRSGQDSRWYSGCGLHRPERFDANTWSTFDGRALAVVRRTGEGAITVTVGADGLDPQTVSLEVGP